MTDNYTTELRTFFENLPINDDHSISHTQVIENGRDQLFDFDYPIFDNAYRKVFETHFIRKFYMREIGFQTFGLFKFQLETWLIINMPYFNKMFESELMQFDPLTNIKEDVTHLRKNDKTQNDKRDITDSKTIDGETNSESKRTGSSNMNGSSDNELTKIETGKVIDDNFSRELDSNNPDIRLALTANDGEGVIEYASSIKENNDNKTKSTTVSGTNTTKETSHVDSTSHDDMTDNTKSNIKQNDTKNDSLVSSINDVEDYVQHRAGKIGSQTFSKMLQEYRSTLVRVEKQIFDEMNELFMLVY